MEASRVLATMDTMVPLLVLQVLHDKPYNRLLVYGHTHLGFDVSLHSIVFSINNVSKTTVVNLPYISFIWN